MLMASPNGYPLSNGRSSSCGYLTGNIPGLDRAQPPRNLDVRLLGQNMATFVPQSQIHPTRGKRFRLRTPLPMSPSPTAMAFKPCTSTSLSYLSRLGTKSNGPHSGTEAHGLTSSQAPSPMPGTPQMSAPGRASPFARYSLIDEVSSNVRMNCREHYKAGILQTTNPTCTNVLGHVNSPRGGIRLTNSPELTQHRFLSTNAPKFANAGFNPTYKSNTLMVGRNNHHLI